LEDSDLDLVRAAREGDDAAFHALMDRHARSSGWLKVLRWERTNETSEATVPARIQRDVVAVGVAGGLLVARMTDARRIPAVPGHLRSPLVDELQLTSDQRERMQLIWEGVRASAHEVYEDAQRLQKERDDALVALLNAEQKARFEQTSKEYARRFEELRGKRDKTFASGVEQTKKLLNEMQQRKCDAILKVHVTREPLSSALPSSRAARR
jgi:hypothetical protein